MRIDEKLNLVVSVDTEHGEVFVHSVPLSRDVFKKYFMVISKTFSTIIMEGLSFVAGPKVAAFTLEKVATDMGIWDGNDGVKNGLMAEIVRLSNVIVSTENGWQTRTLQDTIDGKFFSPEDIDEVVGVIVFFICVCAMTRRTELKPILDRLSLWGATTTLLNCMAYAQSLPILTPNETTIPTVELSSVPR